MSKQRQRVASPPRTVEESYPATAVEDTVTLQVFVADGAAGTTGPAWWFLTEYLDTTDVSPQFVQWAWIGDDYTLRTESGVVTEVELPAEILNKGYGQQ